MNYPQFTLLKNNPDCTQPAAVSDASLCPTVQPILTRIAGGGGEQNKREVYISQYTVTSRDTIFFININQDYLENYERA